MALLRRKILVLSPLPHTFVDLCDALRSRSAGNAAPGPGQCHWRSGSLSITVDLVSGVPEALSQLEQAYYNLVLIDCRNLPHPSASPDHQEKILDAFLDALAHVPDAERRYPSGRVVALAGDADGQRVDRLMFAAGNHHLGGCLRDESISDHGADGRRRELRSQFAESLWTLLKAKLTRKRHGMKAINLAGGGISGIYHELGVLKCLEDSLDGGLTSFDLFSGISAGSIVASCLANGISVSEQLAKVGALDHDRSYRLQLGWRNLNFAAVPRRVLLANQALVRYLLRTLRREDDFSVMSMIASWTTLLGPIFENADLENAFRTLFTGPGRTNDFRDLDCRLFIGATDQDRREHVIFGYPGFDHVPISKAVQASTAMNPFFPSVEIDGRYYSDGVLTRTSNLRASIDAGADLVFVIDPFVPLVTDEPGFNARHGNLWLIEQDYKTLSYTRFEQARNEILREFPHVSVYTFVPSNRMRQLMSAQNPFAARNFHSIVCAAYRSTYQRLRHLEHKMRGSLASHAIGLDLTRPAETVRRLDAKKRPDVRLLLADTATRPAPVQDVP